MRVLPVGARAVLVELDDADHVAAWHSALLRLRDEGVLPTTDVVPAARTVLLDGLDDVAAVTAVLDGLDPAAAPGGGADEVVVPVRYDGADLGEVARLWRMTEDDVVRTHTATTFRVAFCGFAPGFAYLTGLPEHLHVPRRATPRTAVPAGSVGLAGEYAGIYPRSSPGGWQLLGRTGLDLFDVRRDPPALLTPGTRVRFEAAG